MQADKKASSKKHTSRRYPCTPPDSDSESMEFDARVGHRRRTSLERMRRAWGRLYHRVMYKWLVPLRRKDMRPWRRRVLNFVHAAPPQQTAFGHVMTLCIVANTVALAMVYADMPPNYAHALDVINQGKVRRPKPRPRWTHMHACTGYSASLSCQAGRFFC